MNFPCHAVVMLHACLLSILVLVLVRFSVVISLISTPRLGSLHSSGIHQFIVWTAFQTQGLGCNLQHYNFMPNFSARVAREWNLPDSWSLQAQLVFGSPLDGLKRSKPRQYLPVQDRVKVFGSS